MQPAFRIDICDHRFASAAAENLHPLTKDEAAVSVFLRMCSVGKATKDFRKAVEHFRSHHLPSLRRELRENAAGDLRDLLGEAALRRRNVDTDTEHGILKSCLPVECGFRQDTAHLPAVQENIVDPFDAGFLTRKLFHRPADSHGSGSGDADALLRRKPGAQKQAHIQPRSSRGEKTASETAPSRRLFPGEDDQPLCRTGGAGISGQGIGRGGCRQHFQPPVLRVAEKAAPNSFFTKFHLSLPLSLDFIIPFSAPR